MKVKIIKCSSSRYWYKDNVGKTFNVKDLGYSGYIPNGTGKWLSAIDKNFNGSGIERADCEIIEN